MVAHRHHLQTRSIAHPMGQSLSATAYSAILPTIWSLLNSKNGSVRERVWAATVAHCSRTSTGSGVKKLSIEFVGRLVLVSLPSGWDGWTEILTPALKTVVAERAAVRRTIPNAFVRSGRMASDASKSIMGGGREGWEVQRGEIKAEGERKQRGSRRLTVAQTILRLLLLGLQRASLAQEVRLIR